MYIVFVETVHNSTTQNLCNSMQARRPLEFLPLETNEKQTNDSGDEHSEAIPFWGGLRYSAEVAARVAQW